MALPSNLLMETGQPVVAKYNTLVQAVAGYLSKAVGGAVDVTLTSNEAARFVIRCTGTLTGNINLIVPTWEKPYFVHNNTAGAFTLTVKTVAGTGILVPQGEKALLYCDNVNVVSGLGSGSGVLSGLTANKLLYATASNTAATDADLHWDSTNNYLGVGHAAPEDSLHVLSPDGETTSIFLDSYIAGSGGSGLRARHARGTFASPAVLTAGDALFNLRGDAWARDAADTVNQWTGLAQIQGIVDSVDGQNRMGGLLQFRVSPGVSAALTEAMRLTQAGNLLLGTTTFGTSLAKGFVLGNGTAPTTSPSDVTQLWSADRGGVAGKAGLHIRSETGTMHAFADNACFSMLANGQQLCFDEPLTELTTIAAAASTTTAIQIPANAVVFGVSVRVTVAIPTATTFSVGVSGATTRYGTGISVAANTTHPGTNTPMTFYSAATAIVITPNATPSANTGRVRVTIHFLTISPPTS